MGRRHIPWSVVALALLSSLASLLAVELALRVRRGGVLSAKPPGVDAAMVGGYPAIWNPELGWSPKPNTRGRRNPWGTRVTIDAQGVRTNGQAPGSGPAVLAVGDSFTFGDEVDDHETWPAALERRLDRRVVNGGVFGYGLDQIVLRAEQMLEREPHPTLVVHLIPDDVSRCEYAYRYGHKPWFELSHGELVLQPPPGPAAPPYGENALRRALRRSFLAELIVHRLDPLGWWIRGHVRVHRDGEAVSRALVDRLADLRERRGLRLLLVAAWHPGAKSERLAPALARARARGLAVLEIEPLLGSEISAAPLDWFTQVGPRGVGHMTGYGNDRVAAQIARRLNAESENGGAEPLRASGP